MLIVGVSSGIGNALAVELLDRGYRVFGVGRASAANLEEHADFHFARIDLSEAGSIAPTVSQFLAERHQVKVFKYVFLNAGRFSQRIAPLSVVRTSDLEALMQINVWGHKYMLDELLRLGIAIDVCMFSSSIAGVRARAGNSGYAISKATLNMMAKIYALENPDIFFSVLGMCNVDTALSQDIATFPLEGDFPEIVKLRARGHSIAGYVVSPAQRARDVVELLQSELIKKCTSGDFVEIRSLLS